VEPGGLSTQGLPIHLINPRYKPSSRCSRRSGSDRVLRATQFHEFVAELVEWTRQGDVSYVPAMRTQLVAARSVAEALTDLVDEADSAPRGNPIAEVAGPRAENLVEVAKLHAAKQGNGLRIEAGEWPDDSEGLYPADALLPGPIAKLTGPTYEDWLNQ